VRPSLDPPQFIEDIRFKGTWAALTNYDAGDAVEHAGSTWIALQDSTGQTPPTLPTTSNAYWSLIAKKGDTGATGATGAEGPQGDQGIPGTPGAPGADGDDGADGADGAAGAPGEKWFSGAGAPAGGTGIVGDWYLNTTNGDVYEKTGAAAWTLRANITGPEGPEGDQGIQGIPGVDGDDGVGMPVGGATDTVAKKNSATDHDIGWAKIVNANVDAAAAIAESKLDLASDAAAGTASRRTLGTGATQAAAGNHTHYDYVLVTFSDPGTATGVGTYRVYAPGGLTWDIVEVLASQSGTISASSTIIDVNRSGTTIFTTQSNRPTITAGNNTDLADAIEVNTLGSGQYLTADVDQLGTGGTAITVQVLLRRASAVN
jgi:hypothetical protein